MKFYTCDGSSRRILTWDQIEVEGPFSFLDVRSFSMGVNAGDIATCSIEYYITTPEALARTMELLESGGNIGCNGWQIRDETVYGGGGGYKVLTLQCILSNEPRPNPSRFPMKAFISGRVGTLEASG